MRFSRIIMCELVVTAIIVTGLQNNCPGQCNCGKRFEVQCYGNSMPNITAQVPNDTLYYTYSGLETYIDLGSVDFTHLGGLRRLTIETPYDNFVFHRRLNFTAKSQAVFRPLSNLMSLKISLNWNMSEPMPEMFSYLNNLEVLDLSYTRLINYDNLQKSLKGFKDNHVLHRIILKNTQIFEQLVNGLNFNLSHFLEPITHCPLQALDLSYNSLKSIYPGLLKFAPNLTQIVVANNLLVPLLSSEFSISAFFLEVMLHPKLILADFGRQGHGANSPNTQTLTLQTESSMLHPPDLLRIPLAAVDPVKELSVTLKDILKNDNFSSYNDECLGIVTDNVCNIFKPHCRLLLNLFRANHTFFCDVLNYFGGESFAGIPYQYIPAIDDLLNEDCGACFVFPSKGNLRQIILRENINYDQQKLPPHLVNTTICFNPNKLETMDISNSYPSWFPDDLTDLIVQSPITGFNNLKKVNLSGCGLTKPYFNLSASLPNLTSLDFSKNKLTLEEYDGKKYLIGPPTVTNFNLAYNAIRKMPEDTLRTMEALEILDLEHNYLSELMINLTNLPNLRKLTLQRNYIKSISKNMMEQFNEHARKNDQRITIDLRENPLLCTCNERDFVHWIQNAKTHKLYFKGIKNVLCLNGDSNTVKILQVDLHQMAIHCLSASFYISISVTAAVLIAAMIVGFGVALYRKRWWLRYKYFLVSKMYQQHQQQQEAQRNYEYDAFVSYNSRDELWINEELQPKLEDEFGLKLCLHQRDFVLGGNIMEQITSSIENSRKTLLILSPNFLASTWCHWEMNLAHNHLLITGQDVLMLAILSPMSKAGFLFCNFSQPHNSENLLIKLC